MPVTDVQTDTDALTLTITADFAAPVERVWEIYADPRQLEQVWGPPTHPATFVDHDLTPGGRMTYYMTSPAGDRFHAYWTIVDVAAPGAFSFLDGFARDESFTPDESMPEGHNSYTFTTTDGGTRATFVTTYADAESLQKVLDVGVVEGSTLAINQIDGLLAA
jgi:uncharacterized protein YndB with AHSA1/START domain